MRAIDDDPTGEHHGGMPTWPRKLGPPQEEMATIRQLRAMNLRPGGQPVAGQLVWRSKRSRGEEVFAFLYRVDLAKPVRQMTPRKQEALNKAMTARKTCPKCGVVYPYCIPRSLGTCFFCSPEAETENAA